jgi:hypothetical protein
MLCGGIQAQQETTEFAAGYVAAHHAEINSALNVSNASYAVVGEAVQVAGGVVHFLHINGSDGKAYPSSRLSGHRGWRRPPRAQTQLRPHPTPRASEPSSASAPLITNYISPIYNQTIASSKIVVLLEVLILI